MMSIPEQASEAQIREQIVDAAMACFTERGYDRTSVDDIAARSGLSPHEIHHHFADKAEIRLAVSRVMSELLSGWMASA